MLQLFLGTQLSTSEGFGAPEAARAYTRAHELCRQTGETPLLFPTLGGLFTFHRTRGEVQTAHEFAEQLLRLAQGTQLDTSLLWAYLCLGRTLHDRGYFLAARELLERGLALYDPQKHRSPTVQDPAVVSLTQMAQVLWMLGRPEQARQRSLKALTLAREIAHPLSLAHALSVAVRIQRVRGASAIVRELAEELTRFAQKQSFAIHEATGTIFLGWVAAEHGQAEDGIAQICRGLATYQETGTRFDQPHLRALLAKVHRNNGQANEGLKVIAEALALVDGTGERWYEAELYRLKGELWLRQLECSSDN